MEEVGPAARSRRPLLAGGVSLAVHAGLVVGAVALASGGVSRETRPASLTPIEVVEVPPPAPPPPPPNPGSTGTQVASLTSGSAGTLGRHGHGAPRSVSRAPAAADPLADVVVSYDAQTSDDAGHEDGTVGLGIGAGLIGDGAGAGGGSFGLGNVPPAPSLARPPRPRSNYRHWDFRAAPVFAGGLIRIELTIAPDGSVRDARLLKGVDSYVDRHAVAHARGFRFYPALNDAGQPTWGRHGWEFVIGVDGEMQ
jgi:TonB family protein